MLICKLVQQTVTQKDIVVSAKAEQALRCFVPQTVQFLLDTSPSQETSKQAMAAMRVNTPPKSASQLTITVESKQEKEQRKEEENEGVDNRRKLQEQPKSSTEVTPLSFAKSRSSVSSLLKSRLIKGVPAQSSAKQEWMNELRQVRCDCFHKVCTYVSFFFPFAGDGAVRKA